MKNKHINIIDSKNQKFIIELLKYFKSLHFLNDICYFLTLKIKYEIHKTNF